MATTPPRARTLCDAAVLAALQVSTASAEGTYATKSQAESAIGAARSAVQAAIEAVRAEHSTLIAYPVVQALKALAARLLDLDRALAEELQTMDYLVVTERSLLDLARERYKDSANADICARTAALHGLNPQISNPLRIPAGTYLVIYVR